MVFSIINVFTEDIFSSAKTKQTYLFQWMFLCKRVFHFKFINQYTRPLKFLPVMFGSHPVDTLHISSPQSHKPWHLCPYVGYGQLDVQFIPLYPGLHARIHNYIQENYSKKNFN